MKKAQGMPINTIIIVALALIVLIVLGYIFMGRVGLFGTGLSQCKGEGKFCSQDAKSCESAGAAANPMKNCNDDEDPEPEGSYCCIKIS